MHKRGVDVPAEARAAIQAIPTRSEIAEDEVLIEVLATPDHLNRVRFVAFWRDDYLTPAGVRGQVFFTELERFISNTEQDGRTVRLKPSSAVEPREEPR